MNTLQKGIGFLVIALAIVSMSAALAPTAFADDYFGGCCDAGYTDFGSYDAGYTDYGYSDAGYTDYSYNDAGYTDYGYSDAGYTDYGYSDPGYTDWGYSDAGYTDWGYSESPTYYGSDGVQYTTTGGSSGGGSYGGGSSYTPKVTSYPVSIGRPYSISNPPTYTQPRPTPTPAPAPATPSIQLQEQAQTSTNVNNNPNTNVNNNNNVNNININIPAAQTTTLTPVYQFMPVQYPVVQTPTYSYATPYCTITISNNGVNQATLTWSSQNATSAFISPNVGSVSTYGNRVVTAYGTQVFTMTVYGQNGQTATCQTTYTYSYVPPVNPAPYVSLSQIPYTGFDFGSTGLAIYWGSMIAFALAAGYLMVYYRGGALALAGEAIRSNRRVSASVQDDFKTLVTEKAEEKLANIVVEETKKASTLDLPTSTGRSTIDSMSVAQNASGMPTIIINRS